MVKEERSFRYEKGYTFSRWAGSFVYWVVNPAHRLRDREQKGREKGFVIQGGSIVHCTGEKRMPRESSNGSNSTGSP